MNLNKVKIDLDYINEGVSFIYPLFSGEGARILESRVILTSDIIADIKKKHGNIVYYTEAGGKAVIPPFRMKIAYNTSRSIIDEISRSDKLSKTSFHAAEKLVEDILNDVSSSDLDVISLLKDLKDYDEYLYNHSVNVGVLSAVFARMLGRFKPEEMKALTLGAYLHDIGQKRIDRQLLNKEGKLDVTEFQRIKRHPQLGYEIVKQTVGNNPVLLQSILFHHEKFNNRGYYELPYENLPDYPKMVSICDIYDALTSTRPFRKDALTSRAALKAILNSGGSHFDYALVSGFISGIGRILNQQGDFWDKNEICEINSQELALVRDEVPKDMLKPKLLVFCKFIKSGSSLTVKFYPEPFEINLATTPDRHITKAVNNQAQIKSIRLKLQERGIS
jgi:putative nucleotidyltransferase with HDIG domain